MGNVLDSDPGPLLIYLIFTFLLVMLNGFFVASEQALMNVKGSRIHALASEGRYTAKVSICILRNLNAYISSCRMGITITSIGVGWLGGSTIMKLVGPFLSNLGIPDRLIDVIGIAIAIMIIAMFHYVIVEQLPNRTVLQKSEQVTLWSAVPVVVFYTLMYPFVTLLDKGLNRILRKTGTDLDHDSVHTKEEIRELIKESCRHEQFENTELKLMDNVFEFTETVGREIMTPRTELVCLYANKTFEENMEITSREARTRYPVCDPDKDHIIGYVHIKDLLRASHQKLRQIRSIVRPLTSVPETMPISEILKQMQKNRTEIALLIDEYGGTSGLVTMEDILEELVGEIYDEFDEVKPIIEKKDASTYSVDGLLLIDEFNEYFGAHIETEDYDTIGGWLYSQLDSLPMKNQRIRYHELELIIDEVENNRISRVIVKKPVKQPEDALTIVS